MKERTGLVSIEFNVSSHSSSGCRLLRVDWNDNFMAARIAGRIHGRHVYGNGPGQLAPP